MNHSTITVRMSPTKTTIIAALTLTVLANEATAQSDANTNPTQYGTIGWLYEAWTGRDSVWLWHPD